MKRSKKNRKKRSQGSTSAIDDSNSLEELGALIKGAETAVDSFNYDEAESNLKEVLQIDPNNTKSLEMLSGVYIEKFEWQQAHDLLKRCIEIEPEVGYSKYFSIGQLCEGLESINYYEKGIQIIQKELENSENIEPSKELKKSSLQKSLSDAYCSISEIFMTDCCFEENAEEKCRTAIDLSIKSDPSNPETYQCLANFQLVKGEVEEAKKSIQKNLSIWMPHFEAASEGRADQNEEKEPESLIPVYDSRIKTSKLLIELEMFSEASKILESLLEEDDEVIEVWYLLGWLNYIRNEDEYKNTAHFYLRKAKQVSVKMSIEDECVEHINELLEELSKTHPIGDDHQEDAIGEEEVDHDSDFSTDSEDDTDSEDGVMEES